MVGAPGSQGPSTPSMVLNSPGGLNTLTGYNTTKIVELTNIPSGEYLVLATVGIGNYDSSSQDAGCQLYVNYDDSLSGQIDDVTITVPAAGDSGESFSNFALQGTVRYEAGKTGFAVLGCETYNGQAVNAHISAVQASTVIGSLG